MKPLWTSGSLPSRYVGTRAVCVCVCVCACICAPRSFKDCSLPGGTASCRRAWGSMSVVLHYFWFLVAGHCAALLSLPPRVQMLAGSPATWIVCHQVLQDLLDGLS